MQDHFGCFEFDCLPRHISTNELYRPDIEPFWSSPTAKASLLKYRRHSFTFCQFTVQLNALLSQRNLGKGSLRLSEYHKHSFKWEKYVEYSFEPMKLAKRSGKHWAIWREIRYMSYLLSKSEMIASNVYASSDFPHLSLWPPLEHCFILVGAFVLQFYAIPLIRFVKMKGNG